MIREKIWSSWQAKALTIIAIMTAGSMILGALTYAVNVGHEKIKECAQAEVGAYISYEANAIRSGLISIEADQGRQDRDIDLIMKGLDKNNKLLDKLILAITSRG